MKTWHEDIQGTCQSLTRSIKESLTNRVDVPNDDDLNVVNECKRIPMRSMPVLTRALSCVMSVG